MGEILALNKLKLSSKLESFGQIGCLIWNGTVTAGSRLPAYGKIRLKFPGDAFTKYYYVHRAAYMLHNNMFMLPRDLHVSHLCHLSLCCSIQHLSLEPQYVNNTRQSCRSKGSCHGHIFDGYKYPDCVFFN